MLRQKYLCILNETFAFDCHISFDKKKITGCQNFCVNIKQIDRRNVVKRSSNDR